MSRVYVFFSLAFLFFLPVTSTVVIYTLSLHDALPILVEPVREFLLVQFGLREAPEGTDGAAAAQQVAQELHDQVSEPAPRSEEHTSELQSPCNLVCRLLLEKKKQK